MSPRRRAAMPACALRSATLAAALWTGTAVAGDAAPACALVLTEHRSGRALARLALDPAAPAARVDFTHSVLGTPVADHYVWRRHADGWRAHLVLERFEGDGYGLPNEAGPGQTLERDGAGWRLTLDRVVHPLVLPPVQQMRVTVAAQPALALSRLSRRSVELRAEHCPS